MKKIMKFIKFTGIITIILLIIALLFPTWTAHIKGTNSVSALEQVEINGSNHEVMIRGKDQDNPVIIFVHGGPGCSEIPYASKYQNLLENNFTVVNYDQRASGKSYHFFKDYSNLSADLLVDDLLALTDYISDRLGKEKVILIGHSYGTYIATQAASKAPEKFTAYVGIGQMSDTVESEIDSLNYVIKQAEKAGNTDDVQDLQELTGKIKNGDIFTPRTYVGKYGGSSRLIDNPDGNIISMLFSREYNLLDVIRYNYGLSYSQKTLLEETIKNPLPTKVNKLELPCYFVMGKYDYQTSSNAAKNYFDIIEADKKEFITYEQSAHYPQFEEKEKFYEWMCDTFIK
ncbi:alpha/beta hydrolase [Lysinibacillus sp. KCTC 33748]|uniref:alpha/beta fold hydrolase n=1 Tax=unclassified Lysinibacillus TaxID=2636778 RepID=UPI0009A62853|nr:MULTISPECIES: alpha/beta hydrolase [unclassified Lysinibacillus]OXS72513.1 alpha/beta hydrolase [Lysinibacillus sp. KCTC 33748]SKB95023.1 Pimeloyl-ACP methyl ester carboxylesterase [Lysinibacillus sp. AC-3]